MTSSFKDPLLQACLILVLVLGCFAVYYAVNHWKKTADLKHIQTTEGMFQVHHWKNSQGVQVAFVPLNELPIIDIHIVYAAGSAYEGEKFGTAQLLQQLIGEDTADMTGDVIHESFESVGAQFDVGVGRDAMDISLRTLSDKNYRDTALTTLKTILQKTTFTQPAFDREQQSLLTSIMSDKQDPRATIVKAFYEGLYGEHPYAHSVSGTMESVTALTLQDIQAFYQHYVVKQNAIIAIAGDLTLEEAKKLSDQLINVMPSGEVAPSIPSLPEIVGSQKQIQFPSSQTHIMMGIPALAKGNPDYFALTVGNQILGVTPLVNRLFNVVREQQGLAYNVSSSISTFEQPGPFSIYLQSRASEASKAETLVHDTVAHYLQDGPTAEELQSAKDNIYGTFVLGLSNNAAIASHIATLAFYNLPWDYQDHYQENINAVTLEEVKAVFARYIHPEKFTIIRLGETE